MRIFLITFFWFTLPVAAEICVEQTDAEQVCVNNTAQRIISLSPHLTEIFYAIGAGDKLIATIRGSDYPPAALNLEIVGDHSSISIEKLLVLKPDLVALWSSGTPGYVSSKMNKFQITTFSSDPVTLEQLRADVSALSQLVGLPENGSKIAAEMLKTENTLRKKYINEKAKESIRGLLLISDTPLMGLSNVHSIREAFDICSIENLLSDELPVAPIVNKEFLLRTQPDILFTGFKVKDSQAWLDQLGFPRENRPRVVWLDPDLVLRQTPRMLRGIEQMCKAAYRE